MNAPFFVIGDIHGCATELRLLLEQLPITGDSTVVFVGDYIDRGPNAREVIEILLGLMQRCHVVTLLGNHEAMFFDFLQDPKSLGGGMFIYNGGSATLASYANEHGEYTIPREHLDFLFSLKLYHEGGDYFFVHAGVPPKPLEELDPEHDRDELLWTRNMTNSPYRWSKIIVHGHCQRNEPEIAPNHINVDTGCVYNGRLTAIELTSGRIYSVPRDVKTPPRFLRDIRSQRRAVRFEGSIPVLIDRVPLPLHCLTVNYSEVGMYLKALDTYGTVELQVGEQISGAIGPQGPWRVRFFGDVVRRDSRPGGTFYAIDIKGTSSP